MNRQVITFAILFIATAAMAPASAARSPSASPPPQPYDYEGLYVDFNAESAPFPQVAAIIEESDYVFPISGGDPNALACMNTIGGVKGCVHDLLHSLLAFHVGLSPQCCAVVHDIGANCLQNMFSPIFSPFLQKFCAASPKYT